MSKKNVEWEWKKLGDVCSQINGLWKGKKPPFTKVGVIRNTNFTKDCLLDLSPEKLEILDVEAKQYSTRKLFPGDLIIEKSGGSEKQPVGRAVLFEEKKGEYSFSNFTSVLRIKDSKFLNCHFLQKQLYSLYLDGITRPMQSATIGLHNLDFDKYKQIDIAVPPLDEQERIVKVLDDAFEKIDTIKTTAETNLQNAKELFQTTLANELSITDEKIKQGWEEKTLSSIANIISGFAFSSKSFTTSGDYQVIRMGNLKQNEIRLYEKPVFVSNINQNILSKSLLKENDLIVSQTGTKGKRDYGFVARITEKNFLLNQRCACIRFSNKTYFPSLFLYFSYTEHYKNQFFAKEGGTVGQGNVGIDALKNMQIPLPPLSIQKQIVAKLDSLSEKVKQLESNYKQVLADCDELKKAILKKAFNGEL